MYISQQTVRGMRIAILETDMPIVLSAQDAIDLVGSARYEAGCDRVVVPRAAFSEAFYKLSADMAQELLERCVKHQLKLAVVGDFSRYTGEGMQVLLREGEQGGSIFFVSNQEDALERLATV